MEQPIEKPEVPLRSFNEYFFYKLDRMLAIVGIVALSGWALYLKTPETTAAAALGLGALATYIGNRAGK
jgi:hypothetical protein